MTESSPNGWKAMKAISRIQCALESVLILLGITVIVGWYFENDALVQIHSTFVPMQYNTAMGFLFTGFAFLALRFGKRKITGVISLFIFLIGSLTIFEYLFQMNIGIDTLFLTPTIGVDPVIPGRIGANTAFCFGLVGLVLFLANCSMLNRQWIGIAGGIVNALAIASIWGYLSNMPGLTGWGKLLSGMALHTSIGFLLTGVLLYLSAYSLRGERTRFIELFSPKSVAVPTLVVAVCVWQAMSTWEQMKLESFSKDSARVVSEYLEEKLDDRFVSLERMASRWTLSNGIPYELWEPDALNYVDDYPGLQAIEWVDSSNHVKWVAPLEGNQSVVGMYSTIDTNRERAQDQATAKRSLYASKTIDLVQGGKGFLVYVPVSANQESDGFILGVFLVEDFLAGALHSTTFQHHIRVLDQGRVLFETESSELALSNGSADWIDSTKTSLSSSMKTVGIDWDIELLPTNEFLRTHASAWPEAMLFVGLLVASAMAQLVHLLQASSRARHKQVEILEELEVQKQRVEDANRELRHSNTQMEEFTYTVSHDLKSPLVTIQGYAGFMKMDVEEQRFDRVENFADRISDATLKMSATIGDLLELSRVGRGEQQVEVLDTHACIIEVMQGLENQIELSGFDVHVPDSMPRVRADRVRLVQAIQNLVTNAIKYGAPEDGDGEIVINASVDDGMVCISVTDNGDGIAPEFHEKVFGLFQRLHSKQEGTGVGLSIVKRIATLHGGDAWVESEQGKGAAFRFTLPLAADDAASIANETPSQAA